MSRLRWPVLASTWIGCPVRLGAVELGVVSDVIASRSLGHVLGFEVRAGTSAPRFLPWVGAEPRPDCLGVRSVYSLLSPAELPVFLDNGVRLSERASGATSVLRDVVVERDGDVAAVVLDEEGDRPAARVSGDSARPAA